MKRASDPTLTRRDFLSGGTKAEQKAPVLRPPWTREKQVLDHCSACGDCLSACPQNILFADQRGRPEVSFQDAECTFCGACSDACPEPVFDVPRGDPWTLKASISGGCLLKSGITCQSCTDACEAEALRFDMRVRPSGAIRIDRDACTGCGACIAVCPASAITVRDDRREAAA